jgi:hypothetical protein
MISDIKAFASGMVLIIVIVICAGLYMKFNPVNKPTVSPVVNNAATQSSTSSTVTIKPSKPDGCPEVIFSTSSNVYRTQNKPISVASKRNMKIGIGVSNLLTIPSNFKSIEAYYVQGSLEIIDNVDLDVRLNGKKEISVGLGIKF